MAAYKAPLNDIRFVMNDVLKLGEFWPTLTGLEDLDSATAEAVLEEVAKLCEEVLAPLNREADEEGCHYKAGVVSTPQGFKQAYQTFCEGGWCALGGNPEYGGMGMPKTLISAVEEMVQGANISFGLAPMLTAGAALAINAHASDELKALYLPKMYSGQWAGAMDLTEPHCGTDLGLIRTKAEANSDGSYRITGNKIFITWGEHDMAENIVHLVLAKLPDAPEGVRGISMFLVPKFLPDQHGELGERNAVACGSLEKKMGIKASATCVMNYDAAKGWLVGELNKGLACMFTMMNYERLAVGIQGLGVAENAYQGALAYARERIQGRSPSGVKAPAKAADPLLVHPDVRRMLMTMKALNEGGRVFSFYLAKYLDLAKYARDPEAKALGERMTALLTPVAKAFMTDCALQTAIDAQQVLGGHGYIREWGQEQHLRDIRITQIYEGTNGIQAMDLIGRKTVATEGKLLQDFAADIRAFSSKAAANPVLKSVISSLDSALGTLEEVTRYLLAQAKHDPNLAGAAAVDYLNLFGLVAYAYMWALAAEAASASDNAALKEAKLATADYYYKKILPQISGLQARIEAGSQVTMRLSDAAF